MCSMQVLRSMNKFCVFFSVPNFAKRIEFQHPGPSMAKGFCFIPYHYRLFSFEVISIKVTNIFLARGGLVLPYISSIIKMNTDISFLSRFLPSLQEYQIHKRLSPLQPGWPNVFSATQIGLGFLSSKAQKESLVLFRSSYCEIHLSLQIPFFERHAVSITSLLLKLWSKRSKPQMSIKCTLRWSLY